MKTVYYVQAPSQQASNGTRDSSVNTLELLLALTTCFVSSGVFTNWETPIKFALPMLHFINVFFCLQFAYPRTEIQAFTVFSDLLAFGVQYCIQFNVYDFSTFKFDEPKADSDIKNWAKLGMLGGFLLLDMWRSFYLCFARPYDANKRNDDSQEEVTEVVEQTRVVPHLHQQYPHQPQSYRAVSQFPL